MLSPSSIAFLKRLLDAPAPSGFETAAARVWRTEASTFADKVTTDVAGNSMAEVNPGGSPTIMLDGHIDEIGVIIQYIDDEGYLYISPIGGWDIQVLVGQRIRFLGTDGDVLGVVGKKPIHLLKTPEDRKKAPELKGLHIDIGARDGDEARSRVRIGDVAVIAGEPQALPNGRLVSRSLDNRLGCFVALETARLVAEAGGAPGDVYGTAVTQEEITFAGARTTAFSLQPDVAIVVDVTFATDPPGSDEKELGTHKFGSGPVIGRGSTLDPQVFELLHAAGEEAGIPFTVAASARYTGTDADAIHLARGGIPTGVVSIPLRYMHSPVEMVQLEDVDNTAKLIVAFAQKLNADVSFLR
jgi:putative aminopeptidase FrvX